jgi:hypothetical protein
VDRASGAPIDDIEPHSRPYQEGPGASHQANNRGMPTVVPLMTICGVTGAERPLVQVTGIPSTLSVARDPMRQSAVGLAEPGVVLISPRTLPTGMQDHLRQGPISAEDPLVGEN